MNRYEFEINVDTAVENSSQMNDKIIVLLDGRDDYEVEESECEIIDTEEGYYTQQIKGTILITDGVDTETIKADIKDHLSKYLDYAWVWIGNTVIADDYYGD